jgi:molecular chaperone GrpE
VPEAEPVEIPVESGQAPGTNASTPEVGQLRAAVEAAEKASAAARDQQLRAMAELDNVRKRAQRDIESAQRYALERIAGELLAVRDSLELAVQSALQAGGEARALAEGQAATLQLLARVFEKFSIERIEPDGGAFDPALHEAVMAQESATVAADSILQVLQPGYQLHGRLLRPARVIVARAANPGA